MRYRQSTIWNWEGNEVDPAETAQLGLTLEPKLRNLILLQKAYDGINAGVLPLLDLRLQPFVGARTRHNGQSSSRLNVDPMQSGHLVALSRSAEFPLHRPPRPDCLVVRVELDIVPAHHRAMGDVGLQFHAMRQPDRQRAGGQA